MPTSHCQLMCAILGKRVCYGYRPNPHPNLGKGVWVFEHASRAEGGVVAWETPVRIKVLVKTTEPSHMPLPPTAS